MKKIIEVLEKHLEDFPEIGAGRFPPMARAILEAIREPNEAMLRACLGDTYDSDRYEAAATWQAMIDALLAEGEP